MFDDCNMFVGNINHSFGPGNSFIEDFFADGRVVADDIMKWNKVIPSFVFDFFEPVNYRLRIFPLVYASDSYDLSIDRIRYNFAHSS